MEDLKLLSTEATKLWFADIQKTLKSIQEAKLELPGNIVTEISNLLESIDKILPYTHWKEKIDFRKIKWVNDSFIICENVDTVLNVVKEKLESLDIEGTAANLASVKKDMEWKWTANFKVAKELFWEDKDRLVEEMSYIVSLQSIVTQISGFRLTLNDILNKKNVPVKKNKPKPIVVQKPINVVTKYHKNFKGNDTVDTKSHINEKQYNNIFKLDDLEKLYNWNNFIETLKIWWISKRTYVEQLDILNFLMWKKDKETLLYFFRKINKEMFLVLTEEYQDIFNKISEYLIEKSDNKKTGTEVMATLDKKTKGIKKGEEVKVEVKKEEAREEIIIADIKAAKPIQEKKVIEIKPKTQEDKFEQETWYDLTEDCFNNLDVEQQVLFIELLIQSSIEDITIYEFITDFIFNSDENIISYDFLYENQKRLWIKVEKEEDVEEITEAPVIEEVKEKKIIVVSNDKVPWNADNNWRIIIDDTPASLYEAWYKTVPGLSWKTKLEKQQLPTHDKWKTLIWKEKNLERINQSLKLHFDKFVHTDIFSEMFIKYIYFKKDSNDFINWLSNKVIKSQDNFIIIFFEELEKLNLNKEFYSKMYIFVSKIEIENKNRKTLCLDILDKKRDKNFELIKEVFEEKVDEENIDEILKKWKKTLYDWIDLFKWYNNPDFLIERYNKQLVTTIREKKSYNNEAKIAYFNSFRDAFIRNFNEFENPEDIVKYIRRLDINLRKLGVFHIISNTNSVLKELENLNKTNEASLVIENKIVEEIKLLPYLGTTPVADINEEDLENEQEENTKFNETTKWSFNLDFLDTNRDSWISKFLDNLRKHISEEEWFFELLNEVKDSKEKQEELFDLLLIDKSQNERNFLSYLAFQIGKQSESSSDEVNNVFTTIDELQEQIWWFMVQIERKKQFILEIQNKSKIEIESLKNELSEKDQEIERLTKKLEGYNVLKENIVEDTIEEWIITEDDNIKNIDLEEGDWEENDENKKTDIDNSLIINEGEETIKNEKESNQYWISFWKERKRLSNDDKTNVLNNVDNFEDLELFYNALEPKFDWFITSIKQQGRQSKWIELFELFIVKFNEFWVDNNINIFLDNLNDKIKIFKWEKKSKSKNNNKLDIVSDWKNKKQFSFEQKQEVLKIIDNFEDLELFYDKINSSIKPIISSCLNDWVSWIKVWIEFFELFISKFNEFWKNNKDLSETKVKLIDFILENLGNNIKKLNWEKVPRNSVAKSTTKSIESVFDVTKWRDKQVLRMDKKILVLESLTTYEDFKDFYDRFKSWFVLLVSTSKKQEDTKAIAINLFNAFIDCYNRVKWTDVKILEELKDNIKKLNLEFIAKKRASNWPVKKKVKEYEVKNWRKVMTEDDVDSSMKNIFPWLRSTEDKEIAEIEEELSEDMNDKPEQKKTTEELSKEKSIILQNLKNWIVQEKDWYKIWLDKLKNLSTSDISSEYLISIIWKLKIDDISAFYFEGKYEDKIIDEVETKVKAKDEFIIWKNIKFKITDKIKNIIYSKLDLETILIDDNLDLYEYLGNCISSTSGTTNTEKENIFKKLSAKKSKNNI